MRSCTSLCITFQSPPGVPNCWHAPSHAGSTHSTQGIQGLEWLCTGQIHITIPGLHPELSQNCDFLRDCRTEEPQSCSGTESSSVSGVWEPLWSVPLSWCVDKIPARQMDGLPIFLGFLGHLDVLLPPGSFFSLMNVMILAMVMAAPNHSFNNFHYSGQFRVLAFSFRAMCFYVSRSVNSNLYKYISLCLLLILEQFIYSKCLLNGLVTK